jgi:hypothetical protein
MKAIELIEKLKKCKPDSVVLYDGIFLDMVVDDVVESEGTIKLSERPE